MNKKFWGPIFWHILHHISIGDLKEIDINYIEKYKIFFKLFVEFIPCKLCRNHYNDLLIINNIDSMDLNRKRLIIFIWLIHENVNNSLKKKNISLKKNINYNKELKLDYLNKFFDIIYYDIDNLSFTKINKLYIFLNLFIDLIPNINIKNKLNIYQNKCNKILCGKKIKKMYNKNKNFLFNNF